MHKEVLEQDSGGVGGRRDRELEVTGRFMALFKGRESE